MHNIHLVGANHHIDRFNIRSSLAVIGLFGVILIISYFNELARAGLLSRDKYNYRIPYRQDVVKRTTNHDDVILQKGGDIHRLDLNLKSLHSVLKGNTSNHNEGGEAEEINIKVHIGKNSSYSLNNASNPVRIYQHQNIVPNLFLGLNKIGFGVTLNETINQTDVERLRTSILSERQKTAPHNSTMVLLYQHEPGGYALRDCLIRAAYEKHLQINKLPLNAVYRNEWERLSAKHRDKFQVLFGGLSFGACEGIQHSCSYATFVTHPLDRILQVYATCKKNASKSMCHQNQLDISNATIYDFIKKEGNNLFQKLLYYSRHCKLVGDDELCIHDKKAFFLLSGKEKAIYLENVLENLPKWFRTIGLVQHWRQSIDLIDFTYGLNFTQCFGHVYRDMLPAPKHNLKFKRTRDLYSFVQSKLMIDGKPYKEIRRELLNNTDVLKLLHPDLAIYKKMEDIFNEQLAIYRRVKHIIHPKISIVTSRELNESLPIKNTTHVGVVDDLVQSTNPLLNDTRTTPNAQISDISYHNLSEGRQLHKPMKMNKKHSFGKRKHKKHSKNNNKHERPKNTRV